MSGLPEQLEEAVGGLTVRDPYAQALIFGPKRIENRSKRPPKKCIGERIAIHCGQERDEEAWEGACLGTSPWDGYISDAIEIKSRIESIKLRHRPGHIIGTVKIVGYTDASHDDLAHCTKVADFKEPGAFEQFEVKRRDEKGRSITDLGHDVMDDPWWQGPVGWLIDNPRPLDEPIPVRGQLGVWGIEGQMAKVGGE